MGSHPAPSFGRCLGVDHPVDYRGAVDPAMTNPKLVSDDELGMNPTNPLGSASLPVKLTDRLDRVGVIGSRHPSAQP